jgi:glycosyltransferase involved in cell wall biosynthesis
MVEGGCRISGKSTGRGTGTPLVSIITIVFNREKSLENAIKSVINQTYPNIEYIIIDGNSSDNTILIIKKYDAFIDYWRSEPDSGISDAFNKGYLLSTGDFIAYLNSDDWYEPNGIFDLVSQLEPGYSIFCGHVNLLRAGTDKVEKLHRSNPGRIFQTMRVAHPATIVSRDVFEKIGMFSTKIKYAMDYDFMLRAKLDGFEIKVVDKVITNMLLGGNSSSLRGVFKEELEIKNRNLGNKLSHWIWFYLNVFLHKPYVVFTSFLRKFGIIS